MVVWKCKQICLRTPIKAIDKLPLCEDLDADDVDDGDNTLGGAGG